MRMRQKMHVQRQRAAEPAFPSTPGFMDTSIPEYQRAARAAMRKFDQELIGKPTMKTRAQERKDYRE